MGRPVSGPLCVDVSSEFFIVSWDTRTVLVVCGGAGVHTLRGIRVGLRAVGSSDLPPAQGLLGSTTRLVHASRFCHVFDMSVLMVFVIFLSTVLL